MSTYCPCDLHWSGAKDYRIMHVDHNIPQLLLHTTVVHSLDSRTNVWGRNKCSSAHLRLHYLFMSVQSFSFLHTLSSDRLRHWAWISQSLTVDCSYDEQIDRVGSKVHDCKLSHLHMICHCLPAVAHWLTTIDKQKNQIDHKKCVPRRLGAKITRYAVMKCQKNNNTHTNRWKCLKYFLSSQNKWAFSATITMGG